MIITQRRGREDQINTLMREKQDGTSERRARFCPPISRKTEWVLYHYDKWKKEDLNNFRYRYTATQTHNNNNRTENKRFNSFSLMVSRFVLMFGEGQVTSLCRSCNDFGGTKTVLSLEQTSRETFS